MSEQEYKIMMIATISRSCAGMTKAQLAPFALSLLLGSNPSNSGELYEKLSSLFTEKDSTGRRVMHSFTKECFMEFYESLPE